LARPRVLYCDDEDIPHLVVAEGEEENSVELSPNVTAELKAAGHLIGIEILDASTFLRDAILEGAPARLLRLGGTAKWQDQSLRVAAEGRYRAAA
jgi:uncharacterized protein YuzE